MSINATVRSLSETLKEKGQLRANTAQSARDMMNWWKVMSYGDDEEFESVLAQFDKHLGKMGNIPANPNFENNLQQIIDTTSEAAARLRNDDVETYGFDALEF